MDGVRDQRSAAVVQPIHVAAELQHHDRELVRAFEQAAVHQPFSAQQKRRVTVVVNGSRPPAQLSGRSVRRRFFQPAYHLHPVLMDVPCNTPEIALALRNGTPVAIDAHRIIPWAKLGTNRLPSYPIVIAVTRNR